MLDLNQSRVRCTYDTAYGGVVWLRPPVDAWKISDKDLVGAGKAEFFHQAVKLVSEPLDRRSVCQILGSQPDRDGARVDLPCDRQLIEERVGDGCVIERCVDEAGRPGKRRVEDNVRPR